MRKLFLMLATLLASSGAWAEPVELVCVSDTDAGDVIRWVTFDEETGQVQYAKRSDKFKDCKEQTISDEEIDCNMGRDFRGVETEVKVDRYSGRLTVTSQDPFKRRTDWHYE